MKFNILIAFLVVLRIAAFIYFVMIDGQYLTFDSQSYLTLAKNLVEHHVFAFEAQPPFSAHVWRTPGYPLFLAFVNFLGLKSLYWVIFLQELIYGGFVYLFYRYGKPLLGLKITRIGLIYLLIEPDGLAFPKLIMTETLFMPFLLAGVFAVGYYLKFEYWRYLFIAGLLMGIGALIRPAILYLPIVFAGVLLVCGRFASKRWLHVGGFFLAFVLAVSPWLVRNYLHYQKIYFSGQSSYGLAYFHVPMILEAEKNLPFEQGWDYVASRVREKSRHLAETQGRPASPLQIHEIEKQIAIEELKKYPETYAKRWLIGMLKGMSSPLIVELYDVYKIDRNERLHLMEEISKASSPLSGVINYVLNQDRLYLLDVIFSLVVAIFALIGAMYITLRKDCFLWVMMLTTFYFISIPGPFGHGRFRVPVEIFWFVQALIGFFWVKASASKLLKR